MHAQIRDVIPYGDRCVVSLDMSVRAAALEEFREQELDVEIKRHRPHRSLSANAYFHVLCDKLRQALEMSMAECKNHLITSYGQVEYIGDQQAIVKTNIEPDKMAQAEYLHAALVKIDADGVYFYRVYRGSHTYNSAEMSKLIDGTVEECKAQGIETASPDEIARMIAALDRRQHGQE